MPYIRSYCEICEVIRYAAAPVWLRHKNAEDKNAEEEVYTEKKLSTVHCYEPDWTDYIRGG